MNHPSIYGTDGTAGIFDDPALLYDDFDVERFLQDLESRDRRASPRIRLERDTRDRPARRRRGRTRSA